MRNDGRPFRGPHDDLEPLPSRAADGDDEPTARLELLVERGRRLEGGGCDGDRSEGRVLRDAASAVADVELHAVPVAGRREVRARSLGERRDPLDRVHLAGEFGEHRGLVARAGADVEHALARREARAARR